MKKNTSKPTKAKIEKLSYYRSIPLETLNKSFVESQGSNYVAEFLEVAKRICETQASFCFQDFIHNSKRYEIPIFELRRIFNLWTSKLIQWNKLEQINGCFDEPIFLIL